MSRKSTNKNDTNIQKRMIFLWFYAGKRINIQYLPRFMHKYTFVGYRRVGIKRYICRIGHEITRPTDANMVINR